MSWPTRYTWIIVQDPEACYCCDGTGYYVGPDSRGAYRRQKCGACKATGRIQSPRPMAKKAAIKLANRYE